jgi:hypothetical protein
MELSNLKPNKNNPRRISEQKLEQLKKSIESFEKMLEARPIIVNKDFKILGGNMRYTALLDLGYDTIPDHWVKVVEFTKEEEREFIIKDNISYGEFDWDMLHIEWKAEELQEWGMDLPEWEENNETKERDKKEIEEKEKWMPDCLYPSNNMYDVPTLLMDQQGELVELPFIPYGSFSRNAKVAATYHFYVDDYRFEAVWDNPYNITYKELKAIVEPNLSLYDTTPISYGLHLIYKKRWLARRMQDFNIKIFVDLNVSAKFYEYNLLGVPDGWNAFMTRGYKERIDYLKEEFKIAQNISKKENPNFVVYAGGNDVKKWCLENNVLYIEQMRGFDKMKESWQKQEVA